MNIVDKILLEAKTKWSIGKEINHGYNGVVYEITGHPDKVIKLNNPGSERSQIQQVKAMIENSDVCVEIFDYNKKYTVMEKVNTQMVEEEGKKIINFLLANKIKIDNKLDIVDEISLNSKLFYKDQNIADIVNRWQKFMDETDMFADVKETNFGYDKNNNLKLFDMVVID